MSGISSKALNHAPSNRYKFNGGTELTNDEFSDGVGMHWYETLFRSYDPQIGRFLQIDALAESTYDWSPYVFCSDNPILFIDPLGLDTLIVIGGKGYIFTDSEMNSSVTVTNSRKPSAPSIDFLKPKPSISFEDIEWVDLGDGKVPRLPGIEVLLHFDLDDPMQILQQTVVEHPGQWDRFWKGRNYRGKNIFDDELFEPFYSRGNCPVRFVFTV